MLGLSVNNELKECRRKRSCPNLRYYVGIFLEGLRKITKTSVRIVVEIRNIYFSNTIHKLYHLSQLALYYLVFLDLITLRRIKCMKLFIIQFIHLSTTTYSFFLRSKYFSQHSDFMYPQSVFIS
jgi:hypothetical protein